MHRPDPPRTEPIRDFMSYMRAAGLNGVMPGGVGLSGSAVATPDQPAASGLDAAMDQTVAHGVRLGYTVIDEQIRQGEKLAERLRQVSGKPSAMPAQEIGTLIERALNIYKDMGALAVAAVETMVRSPVLQSAVAKALHPSAAPTGDGQAAAAGAHDRTSFGLELTSGRRTQVKLDIRPGAVTLMPVVHALHAANPDLPPLTGVRFRFDPATATPLLHIDVPDGQPAGTYLGVVIDSGTEEPCGTLSVRVLPNPA
ncbi:MAG TPA: hypothetical protein VHC04_00120 [Rhodopila sp.]|nr:hypothetical protein [Rhodopila sp.]